MPLLTFLVEDDETIRENLISTMEDLAGVTIIGIAASEAEALAWLAENPGTSGGWRLSTFSSGFGLGPRHIEGLRRATRRSASGHSYQLRNSRNPQAVSSTRRRRGFRQVDRD